MFVYQNANREICITFQDNKPVEAPEYVIAVDKEAGTLAVNGTVVAVASGDAATQTPVAPAEPGNTDVVEDATDVVEDPTVDPDDATTDGEDEE